MAEAKRGILIVDDNLDLAENLQEILEGEGFLAHACASGEEALAELEGHDIGLVVTDMRMPGLSGLEILDRVRSRFPAVPVVVMTAYSDEALLDAARANGALTVLVKPVGFEVLLAAVHIALDPETRLLLLEDETALRVNLTDVLQTQGVLPYGCHSVEEARRFIASVPIDAAIVDLRLPDGDGIELVREIWTSGRGEKLPIIFITGQHERASSAKAMAVIGPVEVLTKPFDPAGLIARVRSVRRP